MVWRLVETLALVELAQASTGISFDGPTIEKFIVWAGAGLTAVVSGLAKWFHTKLRECETDRKELFAKVETLFGKVSDLEREVGHLQGYVDARKERDNAEQKQDQDKVP
jgi:hypothetical protein